MTSPLVDFLTDTFFEAKNFKRYVKSVTECEDVMTRYTMELMNHDSILRVLVRGGISMKDRCGILYVKYVTECFQKQVESCRKDDIM